MASKRQRRTEEFKTRKKKKTFRLFFIAAAVLIGGGFLAFLFWALSDTLFPPDAQEAAAKRERKEVVLFFSDANERFLVQEKRLIPKGKNTIAQAEEIVRALVEGPKMGSIRTIPAGTRLLTLRVADGTAVLNFDNPFIEQHPGGTASEAATVYSLANTLALNLPEIKRIRIQVSGRDVTTIKGHIDLREPITPSRDIVKQARAGG
ncbi:MAG TPA: GerMN domain-containing protein [Syntrophales bacterium]|nr:GerMN domain-containing protein [Syntrophales bacterium]